MIGWLRPVILLPTSVLTGLSADQMQALLAHELAHVCRNDYLVNLLQTLVETLLFYHPAVWWLSRQIRQERENCCDDLAAAVCPSRIAYARALLAMEELRAEDARLALTARGGLLWPRVRRLLGLPEPRPRCPGARSLAAVLAVAAILAALAGWQIAPGTAADSHDVDKENNTASSKTEMQSGSAANIEQAKAVAEIKKLGGNVTIDENNPQTPVISVDFELSKVTDADLVILKGLPQLQSLELEDTFVADAGLERLKGLAQLQRLGLRGTDITDAGLEHLKGLGRLADLDLGETKVADRGLEHLKGMVSLERLDLHSTEVTDAGLIYLKGLPRLQSLHLWASNVTDAGLVHLKRMTGLRELSLGGEQVTDAGLIHLEGLTRLQSLDLRANKVTDARTGAS